MHLQKEELFKFFENKSKDIFQKKGKFLIREPIRGESILTIVAGKLETIKRATESSVIVRNIELGSSAETYIIGKDMFEDRYDRADEFHWVDKQKWQVAIAKGKVEAFRYEGEEIQFMASWDEFMICEDGDYIARPVGGDKHDIYRIEKDTFKQTYVLQMVEETAEIKK